MLSLGLKFPALCIKMFWCCIVSQVSSARPPSVIHPLLASSSVSSSVPLLNWCTLSSWSLSIYTAAARSPQPPPPLFFYQNTLTFYFLCCHVSTNLPLINYQQMFTAHIHHTHIICTHNKHICCSVCHSPLHCFADSAPEYTVCTLSDNICFMGCHLTLSVDRADDTLYRTTRLWPIV